MSEANLRQIRVLHIVSAGGVASSLQPSLFMPLLTRLPRQRVKAQVACLSPGAVPSAVLRQNGVPTFDLALSRKRFSPRAFSELVQSTRHFRPDVIQAWGLTAQVISAMVRARCEWKPRLVWSLADTTPMAKDAGFIDRQKLTYAVKFASRADRIVYTSEAAAAQHRRVGFPDGGHETVPPGVDATRFKPDFAARRKLREELSLPGESFVIGMVAPFQPEFDHATFLRGIGELIKQNPHVAVILAGHGVQKGNAPLMALVGGGALATRVHLLGEWSDINALYNACDVVCSSAINDQSRMNIVMAMLCGVPCVATGIGAQGEVIGQHGVAVEPGNPAAFVKGITRVMQLSPEKRTHLAQGARKHALAHYVYVRSLQKYLQLYYDLIGRQTLVTQDLPTPEIDASLTVPPALPSEAEMNATKRKPITVVDLSDPDSLESKVAERALEELPKWRIEQEEERKKREAELAAQVAANKSVGDVLQVFESEQAKAASSETPMTERARGVADDTEELLPAELLAAEVPVTPRASHGASSSRKSSAAAAAPSVSAQDAAKQAALKAARMAALQPISPVRPVAAPKASSAVTKPPATKASPMTRPSVTEASVSPMTRPPVTQATASPMTRPPVTEASAAPTTRPPVTEATASPITRRPVTEAASASATRLLASEASASPMTRPAASSPTTRSPAVTPESSTAPDFTASFLNDANESATVTNAALTSAALPDIGSTQPLEMLSQEALLQPSVPSVSSSPAPAADVNSNQVGSDQLEILPDFSLLSPAPSNASAAATASAEPAAHAAPAHAAAPSQATAPAHAAALSHATAPTHATAPAHVPTPAPAAEPTPPAPVTALASAVAADTASEPVDLGGTQPLEMLPEITLLPPIEPIEANASITPQLDPAPPADASTAEPPDLLLPEILPEIALFLEPRSPAPAGTEPRNAEPVAPAVANVASAAAAGSDVASAAAAGSNVASAAAAESARGDHIAASIEKSSKADSPAVVTAAAEPASPAETKVSTDANRGAEKVDLNSTQPMGVFSQALANATLRLAAFTHARESDNPKAEKREQPAEAKSITGGDHSAHEKIPPAAKEEPRTNHATTTANQDFSELSLMATGQWMSMQWPGVKSEPETASTDELSGAEALSLISTPAPDTKAEASGDNTIKRAILRDPALEPKRAANGK